jgi:tRNA pseudouridine55 synthase
MRPLETHDGILLVDKPSGPTSHDVVDVIRRRFGFDKVGHGGTLDPQATGLLLILIGKATKLSARFMGSDKVYEGTIRLGISTDSQDAQGQVIREADPSAITAEQVQAEMRKRIGDLLQTPPMVSAVKVGGVPLYKRARKGQVVEREARLIHVYEFRLDRFESPRGFFCLRCTKGTYVRTLCHEIGTRLGAARTWRRSAGCSRATCWCRTRPRWPACWTWTGKRSCARSSRSTASLCLEVVFPRVRRTFIA